MTPSEILRAAADAIDNRAAERDREDGERSMERAVAMFNGLLGGDKRLSELEGWLFMCCLKMARATAGRVQVDDYVDLAGYAALAAECAEGEAKCWSDDAVRDVPTFAQYLMARWNVSYNTVKGSWHAAPQDAKDQLLAAYRRQFSIPPSAVVQLPGAPE